MSVTKTINKGRRSYGSIAQQQIAAYRTKAIARYLLRAVKSKPEELQTFDGARGVSIQYGCRQIRVRIMEGRTWLAVADFQIGKPELNRFFDILDAHFGYERSPHIPQQRHGAVTIHVENGNEPDLMSQLRDAVQRNGWRTA